MALSRGLPRLGLDRLAAAAVALAAFAIGSIPFPDFDYWWHLAVGRYLVQTHHWPSPDPFSFTASGQVWTVHEWLVEVAMYGLYSAFGHSGPRALFAICFAVTMVIPFIVLRRAGARVSVAGFLALVLMVGCVQAAGPRPHQFSLLLFVVTWLFMERWRIRRDASIWWLPVIFLVWVNLHAGFLPGIAIPMLVVAGDMVGRLGWREHDRLSALDLRRLLLALVLSIGALFCSPSGWRIPVYPFTALGRDDVKAIAEWMPTNVHDWSTWPFFGLAGIYVLLVILRRPRLPAFDVMAAGLFIFAGLWVVRVVPFASIALTLLIARLLPMPHETVIRWPLFGQPRPATVVRTPAVVRPLPRWFEVAGMLPLVVAGFVVLRGYDSSYGTRGRSAAPVRAVATLGSAGLPTPLLNQYNYGGYLIWAFAPEKKVFIDGRSHDLYTHGSLFGDYLVMEQLQPGVDEMVERYQIQTLLSPKDDLLPRYLLAKGSWVTTYEDEDVVVLQRSPARNTSP